MPILLRPAVPADAPALVAILVGTFRDTWAPQMSAERVAAYGPEGRAEGYVRAKGAAFVVAEVDGIVAGFVHAEDGFVHALHIAATMRRRGVGRALMAAAETTARAAGQMRLRLETDTFNVASQALYAALGFEEVDRYPDVEYDPERIVTVLLEKRLEP
ncbi:MAG: GNAT family N-acetyltransferase [Alphaproteobacteria bacterium]|nr:GNAT family N-acetyltransferase [Alphaproteobacteria bacterium]